MGRDLNERWGAGHAGVWRSGSSEKEQQVQRPLEHNQSVYLRNRKNARWGQAAEVQPGARQC